MKTIGVLGGIGPQATMDFEQRVHRVCQQRVPQRAGIGYPPMIVAYVREAPLRLDDRGRRLDPPEASPALLAAAAQVGKLVDFLVIPCNSAHLALPQIARAAGCEVLNMVDLVVNEVRRRGWARVGVLGMGDPVVYTRPLRAAGFACETIDGELRDKVDSALLGVMEGRADDATGITAARQAVQQLRQRNVDGLVFGCTEVPFLLADEVELPDTISPICLLADATVDRALQK